MLVLGVWRGLMLRMGDGGGRVGGGLGNGGMKKR
jgi:hypothetical protein